MWTSRLRHSGKCQALWAAVGMVVAFVACILMMWLLDYVLLWPIELGMMVVLELLALRPLARTACFCSSGGAFVCGCR